MYTQIYDRTMNSYFTSSFIDTLVPNSGDHFTTGASLVGDHHESIRHHHHHQHYPEYALASRETYSSYPSYDPSVLNTTHQYNGDLRDLDEFASHDGGITSTEGTTTVTDLSNCTPGRNHTHHDHPTRIPSGYSPPNPPSQPTQNSTQHYSNPAPPPSQISRVSQFDEDSRCSKENRPKENPVSDMEGSPGEYDADSPERDDNDGSDSNQDKSATIYNWMRSRFW